MSDRLVVMRGALVGRRVEPQHQARLTAICSRGSDNDNDNDNSNVDAKLMKKE
jgi:hypothetical protein